MQYTVSQELQSLVSETVGSCLLKFFTRKQISAINLQVSYRTDLKKTAGLAYLRLNKVEFSSQLLIENSESFLKSTVPHEVAHIITKILYPRSKQNHGPEWKNVMMMLGAEPKTYHSYDISSCVKEVVTYRYSCRCGEFHHLTKRRHNNAQAGSEYLCKKTGSRIIYFPSGD
jgi:SprT protein